MPTPQKTDVVIVGSGPTGLMAAALLRRCGIDVRVLDKSDQQAHESRAFGVQAKSMELFLSMGLADEFLARGLIATGMQIFIDGAMVGGLNFDDIGRADTPFSFVLLVPQSQIEEILVADLRRLGVEVEHQVLVTGFDQSGDDVVVHARDNAGTKVEIQASYLIGADGAHSTVRKALGLKFEGAAYPQGFLLADCKVHWPLDHDHLKLFLHGRGLAVYLPIKGADLGRIIAVRPVEADVNALLEAQGASDLPLAEVEAAIRETSQLDVRLSDPVWTTRYRIHHRGVDRYRVGRVFVAGDAAHIHSPAGGQGMNTGLQDAANLAWKLALVLKGDAPATLLETYHNERWPVGQKVLNYTDKLFAGVSSQNAWIAGLRNKLIPIFAATLSHSGTARSRAFHLLSQLGIRYHESGAVHDDISPQAPRSWRDGLKAGRRAPNALFARNQDVFGLIAGYRFTLLALSRRPLGRNEIESLSSNLNQLKTSCKIPIATHIVAHSLVGRDDHLHQAESTQVFQAYGLTAGGPQGLFLIRPDGYIAYRQDGLDLDRVSEFVRQQMSTG
jgi:2-polyprenyl-6-methoxyphenol hydroxylase-like FAD-dependent oxidoreductase